MAPSSLQVFYVVPRRVPDEAPTTKLLGNWLGGLSRTLRGDIIQEKHKKIKQRFTVLRGTLVGHAEPRFDATCFGVSPMNPLVCCITMISVHQPANGAATVDFMVSSIDRCRRPLERCLGSFRVLTYK